MKQAKHMIQKSKKYSLGRVMRLHKLADGTCRVCGCRHDPDQPHNVNSIYYRMAFYLKHGRMPTIADAIKHCPAVIKQEALQALKLRGIKT